MKILLGNRVLINPKSKQEKTLGGIWIPEKLQEQRNIGTVTHVGTTVDKRLIGKEVMFSVQAAKDINLNGISTKILFITDIIATLN